MTIRYVRSPYIVNVNEIDQAGSKIELFIWNKPNSEPTTPTYTFTKDAPSLTQVYNEYNLANYIKEYITNIMPELIGPIPSEEDNSMWCFFKVKRYTRSSLGDYTLLTNDDFDNVIQIAINGWSKYYNGINRQSDIPRLLYNRNIKLTYYSNGTPYYVNFLTDFIGVVHTVTYKSPTGSTIFTTSFTPTNVSNYKISIGYYGVPLSEIVVAIPSEFYEFTIYTESIDECKYETFTCGFINRYGGWQPLTFYKQQTTNISTTSNQYKMFQGSGFGYDPRIGQYQIMNINGKRTIKLNTGWVTEDYSELIEDLLLSETITINYEPVMVKTKSVELKKHVKDKLINYEIEFEYASDIINNMI